ncbi:MAG: hypothetical protein WA691_10030 [Thermoplasmata archaeon]
MPRSGRRTAAIVAAVIVVLVILALVLIYVPLESSTFQQTVNTSLVCPVSLCTQNNAVYTLGDDRYAVLTGTWSTNATGQGEIVTINNGGSDQPCSHCSDQLYSANDSLAGSFDVSGYGPFHFSVLPQHPGAEATVFQGTVDVAVI